MIATSFICIYIFSFSSLCFPASYREVGDSTLRPQSIESMCFLVYFSKDGSLWLPTFLFNIFAIGFDFLEAKFVTNVSNV